MATKYRSLEGTKTNTKCEFGKECKNEKCKYIHVWRCDKPKCKIGTVRDGICSNCDYCYECGDAIGVYKSESGLCVSCDLVEEEE